MEKMLTSLLNKSNTTVLLLLYSLAVLCFTVYLHLVPCIILMCLVTTWLFLLLLNEVDLYEQ